jgi:hypothetical protein
MAKEGAASWIEIELGTMAARNRRRRMMQPDTNPNHIKRIFVSHIVDGAEHRHTIELAWPVALVTETDILGPAMRLRVHIADKSRLLVKIVSKEVSSVSLKVEDQDMRIRAEGAFAHCPGLASSVSLEDIAAIEGTMFGRE